MSRDRVKTRSDLPDSVEPEWVEDCLTKVLTGADDGIVADGPAVRFLPDARDLRWKTGDQQRPTRWTVPVSLVLVTRDEAQNTERCTVTVSDDGSVWIIADPRLGHRVLLTTPDGFVSVAEPVEAVLTLKGMRCLLAERERIHTGKAAERAKTAAWLATHSRDKLWESLSEEERTMLDALVSAGIFDVEVPVVF